MFEHGIELPSATVLLYSSEQQCECVRSVKDFFKRKSTESVLIEASLWELVAICAYVTD